MFILKIAPIDDCTTFGLYISTDSGEHIIKKQNAVLLIAKLDRLARSLRQLVETVEDILTELPPEFS